jgi:hypothetical protein
LFNNSTILLIFSSDAQGELEHRHVKRFYARTNKNKFEKQITKHERRERLLWAIKISNEKAARACDSIKSTSDHHRRHKKNHAKPTQIAVQKFCYSRQDKSTREQDLEPGPLSDASFLDGTSLPYISPEIHHQISGSQKDWLHISEWLGKNATDPACKVRLFLLSHFLCRYNIRKFYRIFYHRLRITYWHDC